MTGEPIIVRGAQLTEEELGALMAVIGAVTRREGLRAGDDRPLAGGWKSYYRTVRSPILATGRDAWRTYNRL